MSNIDVLRKAYPTVTFFPQLITEPVDYKETDASTESSILTSEAIEQQQESTVFINPVS